MRQIRADKSPRNQNFTTVGWIARIPAGIFARCATLSRSFCRGSWATSQWPNQWPSRSDPNLSPSLPERSRSAIALNFSQGYKIIRSSPSFVPDFRKRSWSTRFQCSSSGEQFQRMIPQASTRNFFLYFAISRPIARHQCGYTAGGVNLHRRVSPCFSYYKAGSFIVTKLPEMYYLSGSIYVKLHLRQRVLRQTVCAEPSPCAY